MPTWPETGYDARERDDKKIRAFFRGGVGDHMYEVDVTKIGQWGQVATKAKDHGALAATQAILVTDKGASKLKLK